MASKFPVPVMPGLRNLYAEDEQRAADFRASSHERNERARNQRFLDAASEFLTRRKSGQNQERVLGPAELRAQENELRNQMAGQRRQQQAAARDTGSLAAYLERQGVDAESAKVMAKNPRILQTWEQGRGRQEDRDFRRQMAQEDRDFRAGESEKDRAARLRAAREAAANRPQPDTRKAATDLRKEFTSHPAVKRYQDVRINMDKVRRAAERANNSASDGEKAASDLSLVFGFMKMLDPGSVVREGEFATAQNAAGVPDRVRNAYNRAIAGTILNPNQRAGFVAAAEDAYKAETATYQPIADLYGRLAQTQGLDPADIIAGRAPAPRPTQGGNVDITQPTGMVRMKAPDGTLYEVDPSEAEEALANGWEPL